MLGILTAAFGALAGGDLARRGAWGALALAAWAALAVALRRFSVVRRSTVPRAVSWFAAGANASVALCTSFAVGAMAGSISAGRPGRDDRSWLANAFLGLAFVWQGVANVLVPPPGMRRRSPWSLLQIAGGLTMIGATLFELATRGPR